MINGSLTVPAGTVITITVGGQTYTLRAWNLPEGYGRPNPVTALPAGDATFGFTVTIPRGTSRGTYAFTLMIESFQDSAARYMNWGDNFPVNLVVQ